MLRRNLNLVRRAISSNSSASRVNSKDMGQLYRMSAIAEDDYAKITQNTDSAFKDACIIGDIEEVKEILEKSTGEDLVNLLRPLRGQKPPLVQACEEGHLEIIETILKKALQESRLMLVAFDYDGQTAFASACKSGNSEVVKLFLSFARNSTGFMEQLLEPSGGSTGNTPLHCAALSENSDIIVEILRHLHDNHITSKLLVTNKKNETVLHLICSSGNAEAMEHLFGRLDVSLMVDKIVTLKDYTGNTSFHRACTAGVDNPALVTKLLGVIPYDTLERLLFEQNSQTGQTAFHSAIDAGNSNIASKLLAYLPNVGLLNVACKVQDYDKNNIFHLACLRGDESNYTISSKIQQKLLVKYLVAKNNKDQTVLHCACIGGLAYAAEDFVEKVGQNIPPYQHLLEVDLEGNYPLHYASMRCSPVLCEFILSHLGGEKQSRILVTQNNEGFNPLQCAVKATKEDGSKVPDAVRTKAVAAILKYIPDTLLEAMLQPGTIPNQNVFFCAASEGDTQIVKEILDRVKYLPDLRNKVLHSHNNIRNTPLIKACIKGHTGVVKTMLNDLDSKTLHGLLLASNNVRRNVVHHASALGNTEILAIIMDAAQNCSNIKGSRDVLNQSRCKTTVDYLVLSKDGHLNTPFHYACMKGRLGILTTLLKSIDGNAEVLHQMGLSVDKQGNTPLHIACSYASVQTTQILLEALAQLDTAKLEEVITASDTKKMTALHHASLKGHDELVLVILEQLNADTLKSLLQKQNENGETALHLCCLSGHLNVFRTITDVLQSSSDLAYTDIFNQQDVSGKTLLHVACSKGNREILQELIKVRKVYTSFSRKNILCQTDNFGKSCLHESCEAGDSNTVRMLLYEAYINNCMEELLCIKDNLNMSAFLGALEIGQYAIVKEILHNASTTGTLDKLLALEYGAEKGTFLHRACKYQYINTKCLDAIVAEDPLIMVKIWDIKDVQKKTFIHYLTQAKRDVYELLVNLLGDKLKHDPEQSNINDDSIDSSSSSSNSSSSNAEKRAKPTDYIVLTHGILQKISDGKCLKLMHHKKVEDYILSMWRSHGRINFYGNFALYLSLTIMLALFVSGHTHTVKDNAPDDPILEILPSRLSTISKWIVMCLAAVTLFCEFLQCFARKVDYFKSLANIVGFWVCIGSLFITIFEEAVEYKVWLHEMGITLVLISIFNAAWMTTKVPAFDSRFRRSFTLAFIMLFRVTRRVCTFIPVVLVVSLAFAVTFYNLFQLNDNFQHVGYSLMKVIVMSTGEYEYEGIFLPEDPLNEPPFWVISCILFIVFLIIMNISVMNLLVASAVGEMRLLTDKSEMMAFINLMQLTYKSQLVKNFFSSWRKKKI